MVIAPHNRRAALDRGGSNRRGFSVVELVVALTIFVATILPLSIAYLKDQKLCRAYYYKGLAMEIVDGEMEVLRHGQWRQYPPGVHDYAVRADAATNLPSGKFHLTVETHAMRLEWQPEEKGNGGKIVREARLP